MLYLQKWSYAVIWCACLFIFLFITAWMWPISAKFDKAAVVSKVSSSVWARSCCIPAHPYKEGDATKAPTVRKVAKELAYYSILEFLTRRPRAGGKRAAGAALSETICFMKRLWCSALALVSELGAPDGGRHLPAGRARPLSLREEQGLTCGFSGTVLCYFCFRHKWQERKGGRKEGSR